MSPTKLVGKGRASPLTSLKETDYLFRLKEIQRRGAFQRIIIETQGSTVSMVCRQLRGEPRANLHDFPHAFSTESKHCTRAAGLGLSSYLILFL